MTGQAKGSLFFHTRQFLGPADWRDLVASLPADDREFLGDHLSAHVWYPVSAYNRLMQSLLAMRDSATITALSRHIATEDLNLTFKMLLKMGSPEFLLRRTEAIWSRYFDRGRFLAAEVETHHWRLTLDAATAEDEAPCAIICTWGVPGWIAEALVLTGAPSGRLIHTRCRFHGADLCEWSVHW